MNSTLTVNHFDRGKPFYPLVMNYLILLIGFKDLAARGVINELGQHSSIATKLDIDAIARNIFSHVPDEHNSKQQFEGDSSEIEEGLNKILGPLELKSEFQGDHIKIDIDIIAQELIQNHIYLIAFLMESAGSLLILAHEVSKDKSWHDKGPLWEFLRHCRNAAAHGGLFNLRHGEPRRPAEWGSIRIENSLNGTPLFKNDKVEGLLSPGDPIRLLWDIEQAYPNIK